MFRSHSEPEVWGFELVCVTSCQSACLLQAIYWSIHQKSWSFILSFLNDNPTSLRKRVSREIISQFLLKERHQHPRLLKHTNPDAVHLPFLAV